MNEIILNVEEGKADINNDGIPDRFVIFDAPHEGFRIDVYFNDGATPGSFALENIDGFDTWRIRVLSFKGKTYLLYENLPALVQVTFVQPMKEKTVNTSETLNVESRACRFGQKLEKRIKKSNNKSLCEFVLKSELQYPKFSEPHLLTVESLNRAETYPEGLACQVDIDNDGKPEQLVKLNFSSGAGTGCGNYYLAILNNAKIRIVESKTSKLLDSLQGVEPGVSYGSRLGCFGGEFRPFVYGGEVYIEGKIELVLSPFHEVSQIKAGKARTICEYDVNVVNFVKSKAQ